MGEILIRNGALSHDRLESALCQQKQFGERLGKVLVDSKAVAEWDLVRALSEQLRLPWVDLAGLTLSEATLNLVPGKLCIKHHLVPLRKDGRFLDVAISEKTRLEALSEVQAATRLNLRPHLAPRTQVEYFAKNHYNFSRGISIVSDAEARNSMMSHSLTLDQDHAAGVNDPTILRQRIAQLEAQLARTRGTVQALTTLCMKAGYSREQLGQYFS